MPIGEADPRVWKAWGDLYRGEEAVARDVEAVLFDFGATPPSRAPSADGFGRAILQGFVMIPEAVESPGGLVGAPLVFAARGGATLLIWGDCFRARGDVLGPHLSFLCYVPPLGRGLDALEAIPMERRDA